MLLQQVACLCNPHTHNWSQAVFSDRITVGICSNDRCTPHGAKMCKRVRHCTDRPCCAFAHACFAYPAPLPATFRPCCAALPAAYVHGINSGVRHSH